MEAGQSSQHNDGDEEEEMNIYLKVIKTVAVTVKKSATVRSVKEKLNDKEGISECLQQVFYNGKRLRDDQKLLSSNIQQNSTLQLFVQNFMPIRLFIKVPSGQKIIEVEARTCDTIQSFKCLIAAKEGINSQDFNLIYAGKLLDDEKTLGFLDIQKESTIYMVITPRDLFPVSLKMPTGEVVKLEVKGLYTVHDVKIIAESLVGFPLNDLTYHGEELENPKTLSSLGITAESVLEMSPQRIQVFIKNCCGKTMTIDVCLEDLVKKVKDKIFHKLRLPADVQSLVFEGKSLNNSRTLASYNIQKHSTIQLALCRPSVQPDYAPSLQRQFKLSDIGISSRDLPSSMTISQLKYMIQIKTSLPVKSLSIAGDMLLDKLSITNYGINKRTVVVVGWDAL
ncbi:uncharacterized protein [Coffea arabica]|uniref:Uncharacterized protein isoform X1 n=1 Tax=Coffea arabica TaxID=13443 RepID=A0ABM4X9B9_COFAR